MAVIHDSGLAMLPTGARQDALSVPLRARYDNWIGGEYVAPVRGRYFTNVSPVTGQALCEVARSSAEDVERALDAAHAAAVHWNHTSAAYRAGSSTRSPIGSRPTSRASR